MNCTLTAIDHRVSFGSCGVARQLLWAIGLFIWLMNSLAVFAQTTDPAEAKPALTPAVPTQPEASPTQTPLTPDETPSPSRKERNNQLLATAAPDEVRWLDTPEEKALALFRPAETSTPKGAVLILHAADVPPSWPASLENLRRNLPQYGWVTLAVALPLGDSLVIPQRDIAQPVLTDEEQETSVEAAKDEAATPPPETPATPESTNPESNNLQPTSAQPAIPRAEVIARHVGAAAAFLREQGQLNTVVLADNSSVVDAMTAVQAAGGAVKALVLVNLQPQEPLAIAQLETLLSSPELPVLDVFIHPDNTQQSTARRQHRAVALRNKVKVYYQLRLPPLQTSDIDNTRSFWLERTRGFMEQHAKDQAKQTGNAEE